MIGSKIVEGGKKDIFGKCIIVKNMRMEGESAFSGKIVDESAGDTCDVGDGMTILVVRKNNTVMLEGVID